MSGSIQDSCFDPALGLMFLQEAQDLLAKSIIPISETREVPLKDALGFILAEDLIAKESVPPFANAAMDGYAVRFADLDLETETSLELKGRVAAGHELEGDVKGGCVRIFTGAPVPNGYDTVVMQENTEKLSENQILFKPHCVGEKDTFCRPEGQDLLKGAIALEKGRRLRPADLGLACAVGYERLQVFRPLKVGLFSTGDEIRDAGQLLSGGAIYDMNRYSLGASLKKLGCEVSDLGILKDNRQLIAQTLKAQASKFDLLITSGGVSVGEEDHVRLVLEELGRLTFWRLAIKPGKPVAIGEIGKTAFIGMPGNPVSSLVTFAFIARPFIQRLGGGQDEPVQQFQVPAGFDYHHKTGKREWLRARLVPTPYGEVAELFHNRDSGVLSSLVKSDGLVVMPEADLNVQAGDLVTYIPFSEIGLT